MVSLVWAGLNKMINPKRYESFDAIYHSQEYSDGKQIFFLSNLVRARYIGLMSHKTYIWYIIIHSNNDIRTYYLPGSDKKECLIDFLKANHKEEFEYLLFHPEWL